MLNFPLALLLWLMITGMERLFSFHFRRQGQPISRQRFIFVSSVQLTNNNKGRWVMNKVKACLTCRVEICQRKYDLFIHWLKWRWEAFPFVDTWWIGNAFVSTWGPCNQPARGRQWIIMEHVWTLSTHCLLLSCRVLDAAPNGPHLRDTPVTNASVKVKRPPPTPIPPPPFHPPDSPAEGGKWCHRLNGSLGRLNC